MGLAWSVPGGGGGGGAPSGPAGGDLAGTYPNPTIGAGKVTLADLANLAANSIIGNNTGAGATPLALTAAQVKTLLAIVAANISDFNTAVATTAALKANNLSDLASAATALVNLAGAPLASPTFTGVPAAPTAAPGTNTTQLATTAFVAAAPAPAFYGARVFRSAALSLANNGTTTVAFDAETFDTGNLHDNTTNPSRILLNKTGRWLVTAQAVYAASAVGVRDCSIFLNGAVYSSKSGGAQASGATYARCTDIITATATTDFVELSPFQNSGGSLAFTVGSDSMFLSAAFLGS